jgi:hypothetical protein
MHCGIKLYYFYKNSFSIGQVNKKEGKTRQKNSKFWGVNKN